MIVNSLIYEFFVNDVISLLIAYTKKENLFSRIKIITVDLSY